MAPARRAERRSERTAAGRKQTIVALRALERRLRRPVVAHELARRPALYAAALRHFGSMAGARKAAGLRDPEYQRQWTRDVALREVVRLARAGVSITHAGLLAAKRRDLLAAVTKLLGGLAKARAMAGIPAPTPRRSVSKWSASKVLTALRARHRRGLPLAFSRVPQTLRRAACTHHGSWRNAVEAIGLRYADVRLRGWGQSDDELLAQLQRLARARPAMTLKELHHHRHGGTWRVRFGSLVRAASRAGLKDWPRAATRTRGSPGAAVRALRARADRGLVTSWPALRRDAPALERLVARHFGTLDAALAAAGLPTAGEQRICQARARALLRLVRMARRGVPMTPRAVELADRSLYDSLRGYFGSFRVAAAILGF